MGHGGNNENITRYGSIKIFIIFQVKTIVLRLLEDDNPEVRIQASQVLGGLLHCQFIPSSKELLVIIV